MPQPAVRLEFDQRWPEPVSCAFGRFFHNTDEDNARLLEGDVVELYGRYIGLTPLLTSLFVKETLPFINVLYMKP